MEYIQCPHCLKKYGVNDKIREASGKTIRCKGCKEPFEITIFFTPSTQPSSEESSKTTEEKPPTTTEKSAEQDHEKNSSEQTKKSTGKKKSNKNLIQIIIASVLGIVLVAALVIAYQFLNNPLPIEASQAPAPAPAQTEEEQSEEEPITTDQKIVEKNTPPAEEKREEQEEVLQSDEVVDPQEESSPEPETSDSLAANKFHGPSNPSDECKEAATNQWFTDFMITNGSMTGKEYIRLLDESSNQTEEVLKLCKDKYLASRITDAARLGKSPAWIETEIEERNSRRYENESSRENEW